MDSVLLESVGFCRGSVLAGGLQRWLLAVPGRGSDEVSEPIHPWPLAAGVLCPERLLRPTLAWSPEVALALGVGKGARSGPRSLGGPGTQPGAARDGQGQGPRLSGALGAGRHGGKPQADPMRSR